MVTKTLYPDWIWIRINIQPKMLDPDPDSNESGSLTLVVLHTYISNMWAGLADCGVLLNLPGERAAQVHRAALRLVGLQPQHARRGELVVRASAAGLLLHLHHVDRVPAALDLLGVAVARLLY